MELNAGRSAGARGTTRPPAPGRTAAAGPGALTASGDAGPVAISALTVPGTKSETRGPLREGAKASVGPGVGGTP